MDKPQLDFMIFAGLLPKVYKETNTCSSSVVKRERFVSVDNPSRILVVCTEETAKKVDEQP